MKPLRLLSVALSLALLLVAGLAASRAGAEWGGVRLASRIVPEQATEAADPALSAGGRYVAFRGVIDEGRRGVFRLDLQNGDLARVATGAPNETSSAGASAAAPSISADGRYVAFRTRAALDPVNDTEANTTDVYVADMAGPLPSYELASAMDASALAMPGPSLLAPRVALSADGRRLAFVNGGQVYLRDLTTRQTILVSVRRDPETGLTEPGVPVPGGGAAEIPGLLLDGAALSADGTTVAWAGTHLIEQVPLSGAERGAIEAGEDVGTPYTEPLWRRVADGAAAPTRRVVGSVAYSYKDGSVNVGSGWLTKANAVGVPRLSADGRTVALVGNPGEAINAFLVGMHGPVPAVRQLTAEVPLAPPDEEVKFVNQPQFIPVNGHVFDVAISADGSRLAFVTARQRFPLAPPNLVTPPPAQLGLTELYFLDLGTEALQRLTHGVGGVAEPSQKGVKSGEIDVAKGDGARAPSLSADGRTVAFASRAANLVAADGNEAEDVFAIVDESLPPQPGLVGISSGPRPIKPRPKRRLSLSAFSLPNGRVKLVAVAASPGRLRARAVATLPRGAQRRKIDRARARARARRPVRLILALPPRLRHLARTREGLYAEVEVVFRSARGRKLRRQLDVRFHVHPRKKRAAR